MSDSTNQDYKVQLDVFEGPLDLLLYLIKKEEVDVHDIPIERITTQYMDTLGLMRMLDLNIAGEFLVMAATLMMIKSRMLLPVEERPELEEEEEEDPRWDLVRQLVEYKKFKDAALFLENMEIRRENVFGREGEGVQLGKAPDVSLNDVSIFDLISAFNEALKRLEDESLTEIFGDRFTVSEKIDQLVSILDRENGSSMSDLFKGMRSRNEMTCTFLALLELIKMKQVRARQRGVFREIVLERHEEWDPALYSSETAGGE
jgi:segregation and condensation protein A